MNARRRQSWVIAAFVGPAVLFIGLFVFVPAVLMLRTSLHAQSLTSPETGPFCGADNFRALRSDPDFRRAAENTLRFTVLVVPLQSLLALLLAIWVNQPGWSRRVLRVSVFIPTTLSLTVTSVLWKLLYQPATATGSGLINGLLAALGLGVQPFLTSPEQALYCIVAMSIWQGVGFQMLVFLAGLQNIPAEQYEAATLDGAGPARRFRHVTLPNIAPTVAVVVIVTTIFALKLFVQPHLMTRGGPLGATQSLVQYMYRAAFIRRDLGLACAAGVVFLVAVGLVTLLQRLAARRWEAAA